MSSLPRILIVVGLTLAAIGVLLSMAPSIPLGRLPGDIRIERPGLRLYLPITSCLVVSLLLSLFLWISSKLK